MKLLSAVLGVVCVTAIHVDKAAKSPLSTAEKNKVGAALTNALSVLKGDTKATSKLSACLGLFPDKKQGKESDALWNSCKDSFSTGLVQDKKQVAPTEVDEEGYKKDWGTEHRSEEYPAEAKNLQHHPAYGGAAEKSVAVAIATVFAGAALL